MDLMAAGQHERTFCHQSLCNRRTWRRYSPPLVPAKHRPKSTIKRGYTEGVQVVYGMVMHGADADEQPA